MNINTRQKKLIELLCTYRDWQPVSNYAESLSCSVRTIYNDLEVLESIFLNFDVEVIRKRGMGVFLQGELSSIRSLRYEYNCKSTKAMVLQSLDRQLEILNSLILENNVVTYQCL